MKLYYYKLALTNIVISFFIISQKEYIMSEEQTNVESGSQSRTGKYIRWFFISVTLIAIIYTVIMATMKKFGGA